MPASSPRQPCARVPPTEARGPAGKAGVGVPAGRGRGRAGQGAVGGWVCWVRVARSDPEGRRLRLAGLGRDVLRSGQSRRREVSSAGHPRPTVTPCSPPGRRGPSLALARGSGAGLGEPAPRATRLGSGCAFGAGQGKERAPPHSDTRGLRVSPAGLPRTPSWADRGPERGGGPLPMERPFPCAPGRDGRARPRRADGEPLGEPRGGRRPVPPRLRAAIQGKQIPALTPAGRRAPPPLRPYLSRKGRPAARPGHLALVQLSRDLGHVLAGRRGGLDVIDARHVDHGGATRHEVTSVPGRGAAPNAAPWATCPFHPRARPLCPQQGPLSPPHNRPPPPTPVSLAPNRRREGEAP